MFESNNLRKIRKQKGLSQLELGRKTKIASQIICNLENGKQYPYPGWRKRLAKALGVREREIFPSEVLYNKKQ